MPDARRPGRRTARASAANGSGEDRLLAATERLLRNVPFRDLSVEDILQESGVSRRTFYAYFASKYGVLTRLTEAVMTDIFANLAPVVDEHHYTGGPDTLARVIEAGCEIWADNGAILRAAMEHWQDVDDLREMWLEVMDRMAQALGAAILRERVTGGAPPDGVDPEPLAATLLWATAGVLHTTSLREAGVISDTKGMVESIISIWIGAVYGGSGRLATSARTR